MISPALLERAMHSVWIKIVLVSWMILALFVHLLLFGPPEFWFFIDRLGLAGELQVWQAWLRPFFVAEYRS